MILDSFCSTIELSAEKEDLVIRLLALLGESGVDVSDVGNALEKLGFEGGEEEREGEVGTLRGSEKQQAFVRQLIREERRQSKEERERSKALKDSLKAEKRKLYAQQQQQQQERFLL